MSDYQVNEEIIIRKNSLHYTGKYAGTYAKIKKIIKNSYCELQAYDGYEFSCPIKFIEKKIDIPPIPKYTYSICNCGAHKTYGEDCPPFFHFDYCPLYRPKTNDK